MITLLLSDIMFILVSNNYVFHILLDSATYFILSQMYFTIFINAINFIEVINKEN